MKINNSITGASIATLLFYGTTYYSENYFVNVTVSKNEEVLNRALYNVLCLITMGYDVHELSHMTTKGALQRLREFTDYSDVVELLNKVRPKHKVPKEFFDEFNEIIFNEFERKDAYPIETDNLNLREHIRGFNKHIKGKDITFNPYCATYRDIEQPYGCLGCPFELLNGKCLNQSSVYQHTVCFTYNEERKVDPTNVKFRKIVSEFARKYKRTFKKLLHKPEEVLIDDVEPCAGLRLGFLQNQYDTMVKFKHINSTVKQTPFGRYKEIIEEAISKHDIPVLK